MRLQRRDLSVFDIPGPRGRPVVGSFIEFGRDPLAFLTRMKDEYGDIVLYQGLEHLLVQLNHPDLIEEVYQGHWRSLHKDQLYKVLHVVLGEGLVTAEGDTWKRHRKVIGPSFRPKQIAVYADVMVQRTKEWCASLPVEVELHHALMELTQAIVLDTLFGSDLSVPTDQVAEGIEVVMKEILTELQGYRRFVPDWMPSRGRRRVTRTVQRLDALIYDLIATRRRMGLGDDMLSRLLKAHDDAGVKLTDKEVRDEAVTLFLAGHETTSTALTYTLLLLGDHPEVEDRLRAEVDEVLGSRDATVSDVARLPYTEAIINESMRMLPPVWLIGRENQEDIEVGGHRLPRGCQILVSQWVLHHDARWFPEPERFWPERWIEQPAPPKHAFMPFGAGPRLCIGNRFAMMEAVLVLATVAQRVRFRPHGRFPPRTLPSVTLRPRDAVWAHTSRRAGPDSMVV